MNVTIESVRLLLDRIYFGSHYPINNRNMNDDIKKTIKTLYYFQFYQ